MSELSKFKEALAVVVSVPKKKADARVARQKKARMKKRQLKK